MPRSLRAVFLGALSGLGVAMAVLPVDAAGVSIADLRKQYARPQTVPFPAENPYSFVKALLGKMLFFDPRLSRASNIACASCHNPSFGWETPVAGSVGDSNVPLGRNSPTTVDHAWATSLFWDGRAATLEHQALGPIQAPAEMNMNLDALVERLSAVAEYKGLFDRAFPGEGITASSIARALATYQRTQVSSRAPFDRWVDGDDGAISPAARRGFELFVGKARCAECHSGWSMTDHGFHDIGLHTDDPGRAELVPDDPAMQHAFKTPSLRDTARRGPYMHNGSIETLRGVIDHYVTGGMPRVSLSSKMRPLDLEDAEIDDLLAFLETLNGAVAVIALPTLPN